MGVRVGSVLSWLVTDSGSEAWKALRLLIVRGIPLKDMHLSPTSRISSATATGWPDDDATLWRTESESGELRVKVAADCGSDIC